MNYKSPVWKEKRKILVFTSAAPQIKLHPFRSIPTIRDSI